MGTPTNTKNVEKPYKRAVFEDYLAWRSIPAFVRTGKAKKLATDLGRESAEFGGLLQLRTQTEFAAQYGVENSTLSNWNRLIERRGTLSETRRWASKLTGNVLFALYQNILRTGNARAVALWFEIVHGWDRGGRRGTKTSRTYAPITVITQQLSQN